MWEDGLRCSKSFKIKIVKSIKIWKFIFLLRIWWLVCKTSKAASSHKHWENLVWINTVHLLAIHLKCKRFSITSHSSRWETFHITKTSHIMLEIWEISSHLWICMHRSRIVKFSFFGICQYILCFINISKYFWSFILLYLRFVSVSIRMIL